MTLRRFLSRLERSVEPTLRTSEWRAELGDAAFAALALIRWLRPGEPAKSWSCPFDAAYPDCPMVVQENSHDDEPFVAVCGARPRDPYCSPVLLTADALSSHRVSVAATIDALRNLLQLEGRALQEPVAPRTYMLGEIDHEGVRRDVHLAFQPQDAGARYHLQRREQATRGTVVLVPTASSVPGELTARYASGRHVEVWVLEDMLSLAEGTLSVRLPRPPPRFEDAPLRPVARLLMTGGARRELTASDVGLLRARAEDFDVFLDVTGPSVFAAHRTPEGTFERVELEARGAQMLAEIAAHGGQIAIRRLPSGKDVGSAVDMFQRARRTLDLRAGPRKFMCWHTRMAGKGADATEAVFSPDAAVHFAILLSP